MADFRQIDEARRFLGLKEEASLQEIKEACRSLSLRYHPDRSDPADKERQEEEFKRLMRAKDLIMSYCANYRFSFREDDVKKNILDRETYEHLKRFYDGLFGELGL